MAAHWMINFYIFRCAARPYTKRWASFLFMRFIIILLCLINWIHLRGQDIITGTVIDLATDEPIVVNNNSFRFFLSGTKTISLSIDSTGRFAIKQTELGELGDTLNIYIGTIGTDYNYADFEIINIPVEKLELILEKLFVTKTFMISSCGSDCFIVNNKRTYKRKSITVDNGILKYIMKRVPENGVSNSPFSKVKYQTDFKKDLL